MPVSFAFVTYQEEGILDGGLVVHGAEEVFFQGEDHELLEEAVSHHELFCGARNVSIVVHDAHAGESCDLHLKGHVRSQIDIDLDFASRVGSYVSSTGESSAEALVPNLVNHFWQIINY